MNRKRENQVKTVVITLLLATSALLLENKRKKRIWWIKPWLNKVNKRNIDFPKELHNCCDEDVYKNFLRMDEATFNKLLHKIKHKIEKVDTKLRQCIPAKDKLIVTLRYLVTGESYRSLMYNYRISESTISLFVPVVCKAIYETLKYDYLHVPNTTAEWLEISRNFEELWNMPNTIGALDGKHIVIKAPGDQGSAYFNYKGKHSIVLLALVDANYNFTYVNIGMNGRLSDGGVYRESDLFAAVEQNKLNIPEDKPLPFREKTVPYVIVADAAFPLSTHIMKPYPFRNMTKEQRIFNYRLSRARRVVENTFGILANRFRILLNTIALKPEKAQIVVQACVAMHNYLRKELQVKYTGVNPEEEVDRRYRFLYGLSKQRGNRSKNEALEIRQEFLEYVNGPGAVPWQENI